MMGFRPSFFRFLADAELPFDAAPAASGGCGPAPSVSLSCCEPFMVGRVFFAAQRGGSVRGGGACRAPVAVGVAAWCWDGAVVRERFGAVAALRGSVGVRVG